MATNSKSKPGVCEICKGPTSESRAVRCKPCWKARPTEGRRTTYRKYRIKKTYNITLDEYDKMLKNQDGKCAICLIEQSELAHSLFVDHDRSCCPGKESCGKCVRGLLCNNCNFGLGQFKDNETNMKSAIKYINKYKKEVI
jgi:hypothetical protein